MSSPLCFPMWVSIRLNERWADQLGVTRVQSLKSPTKLGDSSIFMLVCEQAKLWCGNTHIHYAKKKKKKCIHTFGREYQRLSHTLTVLGFDSASIQMMTQGQWDLKVSITAKKEWRGRTNRKRSLTATSFVWLQKHSLTKENLYEAFIRSAQWLMTTYWDGLYKENSVTLGCPSIHTKHNVDLTQGARQTRLIYLHLANGMIGSLLSAFLLDFPQQHVQIKAAIGWLFAVYTALTRTKAMHRWITMPCSRKCLVAKAIQWAKQK